MAKAASGTTKGYALLRGQTAYWKYFTGVVVSRIGDSLDALAYAWLVFALTGSASMSAVVVGVNALPSVLLTPLAAPLVDHLNKKAVIITVALCRAAIVCVIAALHLFGLLAPWMLIAGTFLTSSLEAFEQPAGLAAYPRIVPRECFTPAKSLTATATQVAQLAGTAAAGLLIATIGVSGVLFIDAATYIFYAITISLIRLRAEEADVAAENTALSVRTYLHDLREGFTVLRSKAIFLFICGMAAVFNMLLVPMSALQAPFADLLSGDATPLSIIGVSVTLGMLLSSALYPALEARFPRWRIVLVGTFAVAAGYLSWVLALHVPGGLAARYAVLAVGNAVLGLGVGAMNMAVNLSFMQHVEERYMARIGSVMGAGCMAMMPLGAFGVAALAAVVPVPTLLLVFGLCLTALVAYLPALRTLREL